MFFRHVIGHLGAERRERLDITLREDENRLLIEVMTLQGQVRFTSTALYKPSLNDVHLIGNNNVMAAPEPSTAFIVTGPPFVVNLLGRKINELAVLLETLGLVEGVPGIVERVKFALENPQNAI